MATIIDKKLDGRLVSHMRAKDIARKVLALKAKKVDPKLVIIQIGDVAESAVYVKNKKLFAEKIGVIVEHSEYPKTVKEKELLSGIARYNADPSVHGILLQLPVPRHLDENKVIESISPEKDVDGLTSKNVKLLVEDARGIVPPTTKGIMTLLEHYGISIPGKKAVIVGRSSLVGKPTASAFLNRGATVTICHSRTKDLTKETKQADILVVAAGHPRLIGKKHVSRGQIVIDVGITALSDPKGGRGEVRRRVVGDVDYENVRKIVKGVSPVPGGAGPMTVLSIFENLLEACLRGLTATSRSV